MKEINVGIITFHRAVNYGAVLQTYALQKALEKINVRSEVIDYRDNIIENRFKFFYNKSLKRFVRDLLYYPVFSSKNKKFEFFLKNYIKTTDKIYTNNEQLKTLQDFDKYITGSDQVWNYKLTKWDKAYFLNFVKDNYKKCSYAASFGLNEIPSKEKDEYIKLLSQFNQISVRESKGAEIVYSLLKRRGMVDLDPTLLLDKKEWSSIAKIPKEKDYILVFVMQKNDSTFKFAEELAKKKNCDIVYISDSLKRRVKAKYKYSVSPDEWLGYFLNAKYIITNSFHGLAFSINLNKDFFIELQREPATGNSRLENMLDTFNLRERLIVNAKNDNVDKKIDWNKVNKKMEECRQSSMSNLKKICFDLEEE